MTGYRAELHAGEAGGGSVPCTGPLGEVLATLEEAHDHNYSAAAALSAAYDHIEDASALEARLIAATLASFIVFELNPAMGGTNLNRLTLDAWLAAAGPVVARMDPAGA